MRRTAVYYDPLYLEHDTGIGHPERAERLEAAMKMLEKTGLAGQVEIRSPRDAKVEEIELVHPTSYIEKVRKMAESGGGYLDMDTPVSPRSYDAALRSAGAGLDALERITSGELDNAFLLARPPGHHATATRGMGFCLFNNNAITARYALRRKGMERVLIVDWDAHHGNGIQDVFYAEREVLYVSTHQYPHYPGSGFVTEVGTGDGEGFTVNFPFPAGTGEKAYLKAFDEVIIPVARQYRPDLILVSAGYDGHFSDPLCSMLLSSGTYREMAERLVGLAEELCGGRIIVALEGGYNLMGLAASVAATVSALAGVELDLQEEVSSHQALGTERGLDVVEAAKSVLSPYWSLA